MTATMTWRGAFLRRTPLQGANITAAFTLLTVSDITEVSDSKLCITRDMSFNGRAAPAGVDGINCETYIDSYVQIFPSFKLYKLLKDH